MAPSSAKDKWSSLDELHFQTQGNTRVKKLIWIGITVFAVALIVSGVFFITNSQSNSRTDKRTTFTSKTSGLKFSYPANWLKKGKSFLANLTKGNTDPGSGNEIILIEEGQSVFRHMLIVSSAPVSTGTANWVAVKEQIQTAYQESASTQGIQITFQDLMLPPGTDARGIQMSFSEQGSGLDSYYLQAYIIKGNQSYTIILNTPLNGGGGDQQEAYKVFDEIIKSMSFS